MSYQNAPLPFPATQTISFAPNKTTILAPHFIMYVKNQLANDYGEEMVEKGGLNVVTTLDYNIQKLAEKQVKQELDHSENLRKGLIKE